MDIKLYKGLRPLFRSLPFMLSTSSCSCLHINTGALIPGYPQSAVIPNNPEFSSVYFYLCSAKAQQNSRLKEFYTVRSRSFSNNWNRTVDCVVTACILVLLNNFMAERNRCADLTLNHRSTFTAPYVAAIHRLISQIKG